MIFNELYRKYFLHQAVSHPALLHTEESKVFEMIGINEAVGDFRSVGQEKGFILRPIWYTYGFGFAHENVKRVMAGFIVAKYYSMKSGGKTAFYEAMRDSEKANDELIAKIIKDSKNEHPLFYNSCNDASKFHVQPKFDAGEVGYVGWLTTFEFSNFWNECAIDETTEELNWINPDGSNWIDPDGVAWTFDSPVVWLDGGLTPHEL